MLPPVAALRLGFPFQVGIEQRVGVVFVQARVFHAVDRLAGALGDSGQGFRVAPERAAHHAVEGDFPLRKIFPQPARLPPAELGELVVVVRPEGRLPVPDQYEFSHRPGLYGTIAP